MILENGAGGGGGFFEGIYIVKRGVLILTC